MKQRKPLTKIKKTTVAGLVRKADKLAAQLCYRRVRCEMCGTTGNSFNPLQWAHMIARSQSKRIRWEEDNCFLLCKKCHGKSHWRPAEWTAWLIRCHSVRYLRMQELARSNTRPIHKDFMEQVVKVLEAKLA